ncbi:MAG TPA: hypothetical protein PKX12_10265 [Spirochaetota bacterium]|nr:hypothetical protein [Spirochaetota bacterium]
MGRYRMLPAGMILTIVLSVTGVYGQDKMTSGGVLPPSPEVKNTDFCAECHKTQRGKTGIVVSIWSGSIHAKNNGSCNRCHGGNPNTNDVIKAKLPQDFYIGTPAKTNMVEFCGRGGCHRPTIRVFAESPHYESARKQGEPNCVSCHGSHNVQTPAVNIISEEGCARCHPVNTVKKIIQSLVVINDDIAAIQSSIKYLQRKNAETGDIAAELIDVKTIFHRVVHGFSSEDVQFRRKEIEITLRSLKNKIETRVLIARRLEMLYFISAFLSFGLIVLFSIYALRMYSRRKK